MPTVRLECDGCNCDRQGKPGMSLAQLRDELATVGWLSDSANDRDACPRCLVQGRLVSA